MRVILSFLFLLILWSCADELELTERPYPRILTGEVNIRPERGIEASATFLYRGDQEIIRYGFLWANSQNPALNNYAERKILNGSPGDDGFSTMIVTAQPAGRIMYIRGFVETRDGLVVYGNEVRYTAAGGIKPVITDFDPRSGTRGDTLSIRGEFLSYDLNNTIIRLNDHALRLVDATDSLIHVQIPADYADDHGSLNATIYEDEVQSDLKFALTTPEIIRAEPSAVVEGDTILISGRDFSFFEEENIVRFDALEASVLESNKTTMLVVVPMNVQGASADITVQTVSQVSEPFTITMKNPLITDYFPREGQCGTPVKISGIHFSTDMDDNQVYFGDARGIIRNMDDEALYVSVPGDITGLVELKVVSGKRESPGGTLFQKDDQPVLLPGAPVFGVSFDNNFDNQFGSNQNHGYPNFVTDRNGCEDFSMDLRPNYGGFFREGELDLTDQERFTISFWIYSDIDMFEEEKQPIIASRDLVFSMGYANEGRTYFEYRNGDIETVFMNVGKGWHMITWVYDQGIMTGYVDGRQMIKQSIKNDIIFNNMWYFGDNSHFDVEVRMTLDELYVYHRPLSAAEVMQLYYYDSCDAC